MPHWWLELVDKLLQQHQFSSSSRNGKHTQKAITVSATSTFYMLFTSQPPLQQNYELLESHRSPQCEPASRLQLLPIQPPINSCIIGSNQVFSGLHLVLPSLEQAQTAPNHERCQVLCHANINSQQAFKINTVIYALIQHKWWSNASTLHCVTEREQERERERRNLNERVALAVINFQDGCHVSTAITIIRRTENRNHFLFLSKVIHIRRQADHPKKKNTGQAKPQNRAKYLHGPSYILP